MSKIFPDALGSDAYIFRRRVLKSAAQDKPNAVLQVCNALQTVWESTEVFGGSLQVEGTMRFIESLIDDVPSPEWDMGFTASATY